MTKILFKSSFIGLVCEQQIEINFSHIFNRKIAPPENERDITNQWNKREKLTKQLWNGTKFRLHKVTDASNGSPVKLDIGITDYKDFLGTNYSPSAKSLQKLGHQCHGNTQAYFADPLGVGALVTSTDNCMILIRKSIHCGEAVGCLDVPGGHPEPQEIFGRKSKDEIINSDLINPSFNTAIAHEIFQSILREVRDEINIPIEHLKEPLLMGIAGNEQSYDRPTVEFFIRSTLDSTSIRKNYNKGVQSESFESTEIILLPLIDTTNIETEPLWTELTPSAKAAINLYKSFKTDI